MGEQVARFRKLLSPLQVVQRVGLLLALALYPYANSGGEVDMYRLKLDLNEIGGAYLLVSDYAAGDYEDA